MVIARKIAYNVIINAVAKVLSTVVALVGIGFITRYLREDGFGNYATVIAFFSFFGSLADLGLYNVATREISRVGADEDEIMGNVFSLRIASSIIVFLMSPLVVIFLPYTHEVKMGIIIAAAAFVFSSTYMVLNGIFQKNLAMYKVAGAELIGKLIQLLIIILAFKYNLGFNAVISSLLVYMIFNFFVVFALSRRYLRFKMRVNLSYWKKFLKESFPMGVSVMVTFLYFKADTIMLSVMKSSADVGIYNAAYKIIENITFFPAMIIGLIFPLMSRFIFSDKKNFERISNETVKVFSILVVPLVVGTIFLAGDVIRIIGGTGFAESANILRILIFALALIFYGHFFNSILLAGNLQKKLMIILSFCAGFNIIANLILIPYYSYKGAAITSVITELLVVILTAYLVVKNINYKPKIENWARILFSGLIMALFLFIFKDMNFLFLALGSSIIYFILLWITKVISAKEIINIVAGR